MQVKIFLAISSFLLSGLYAHGQRYLDDLPIEKAYGTIDGKSVIVSITLTTNHILIAPDEVLVITPIIVQTDGKEILRLSPIRITGYKRVLTYAHPTSHDHPLPLYSEISRTKYPKSIKYKVTIPFSSWMYSATLSLEEVISTSEEISTHHDIRIIKNPFLYDPNYYVSYYSPHVKIREGTIEEQRGEITFRNGEYHIDRQYKNNKEEMAKINQTIKKIKADKEIELIDIKTIGFASPNGPNSYNQRLAKRRTETFTSYIRNQYLIPQSKIISTVIGEDWPTILSTLVEYDDNIAQHISPLREISDLDSREQKLLELLSQSDPSILYLLYEDCRRLKYTIKYRIQPFNLWKTRKIFETSPERLTLDELYQLSKMYDPENTIFKDIIDYIGQRYPNDETAAINHAINLLIRNEYSKALEILHRAEENPKSWDVLALAYARINNYPKAKFYFEKAMPTKSYATESNYSEFRKVLQDQCINYDDLRS